MKKFVSFDVFDTCLIRRCGTPEKIWDLMAENLFNENDFRGKLTFAGNRQIAEKNANIEKNYPTLRDIYEHLNVNQWGFNTDEIMNLEMKIEEQELFPNPEMLNIVSDYREKGFIIAFISDMYLPTVFIKKLLVKFNFCKEDESVFVSADCKAGKFNGSLYDFVLKITNSKARQWIHYGDNVVSDFYMPKLKGIKSKKVTNSSFTNEEFRWIRESKFYIHKHEIELWTGLCRMTRSYLPTSIETKLAIDFIVSVYVPYVIFVLRTAKDRGIERLFFLGRDGHIFYTIAQNLSCENRGVDCRYIKVSRKALYRCVFYKVDDYELSLCITENKSVEQNLDYIGISYDDLSDATKKEFAKEFYLNSSERKAKFKKSLQKYDSDIIKKKSRECRTLFLKYLEQNYFFEKKCALVDLGWTGSCRCIINHILRMEEQHTVPMFYWGVNQALKYGLVDDDLFVFNKNIDFMKEFSCSNLFLEQYASMNKDGSCQGYIEKNGKIVEIERKSEELVEGLVDVNENAAYTFVKNICDFDSTRLSMDALHDIFLCCGVRQMQNILRLPEKETAKIFGKIKVEDYGEITQLNSFLSIKDICALLIWGVPVSFCWSELSIRKTFGPFAPAFRRFYKWTSKSIFAQKLIVWWERRKNSRS